VADVRHFSNNDPRWPDATGLPSVLAVTSEVPWPLDSGGHLRTYHLLRALARRMEVRLVVPAAPDRVGVSRAALRGAGVQPSVVALSRRTLAGESVTALRAALDREPYVLFARHRRPLVRQTLQQQVVGRAPAAVYLDHLDSLVYADAFPALPLVVDMHNVYSRLASRMAGESASALRRRYLERESVLLERMERRAVRMAHTVLAVSDDEARYFLELGARNVVVVPNGVDCDAFEALPVGRRQGPPTLLYVGSLAWPPNVSAAHTLATEILPAVRQHLPDARVVIVGRDPGPELLALARPGANVEVAGNVQDVMPYYRNAHVLAVPLQSGGGTRLKILEAFAAGVPVVSTPVGCEGIAAIGGRELEIAGREDFAAAIVRLLTMPEHARMLADRARALARRQYDWSVVGALACDAVLRAAAPGHMGLSAWNPPNVERRVPVS
jgi:glycosyltransferase involved in cell wall biosynthesis